MALSTCKECGGQVSTEAKACPHCGAGSPALVSASSAKVKEKKGMSKTLKIILWLWLLGMVGTFLLARANKGNSTAPPATARSISLSASEGAQVNRCFDRGHAVGTVYVANLKAAIDAGMTASDMMRRSCKDIEASESGSDCYGQCEAGFKHGAKTALNK